MPDLVVYSKCDLLESMDPIKASPFQGDNGKCRPEQNGASMSSRTCSGIGFEHETNAVLRVSSKTGEGLDALTEAMNARLFANRDESEDIWITSEREKTCLEEALAGIDRTLSLIRTNPAVELIAFEMQLVRRALQSITGEISSEDVLQKIFAGFCIGK